MPSIKHSEKDFVVKPSSIPNAGNGLFAISKIQPGDIVGFYTGIYVDDETADKDHVDSDYVLKIADNCNVVGEGPDASYTRFINHCPYPNTQFVIDEEKELAWVESLELIEKGEELFIDYGEEYWEQKEENDRIDANV